jgi:hypothetical protein
VGVLMVWVPGVKSTLVHDALPGAANVSSQGYFARPSSELPSAQGEISNARRAFAAPGCRGGAGGLIAMDG